MQTLWLYGVIGSGYVDSITDREVRDDLARASRSQSILVRINSPGGDVFQAVAMRTLLAEWPAGVDVQIDGLAASAASYIATVGRTVTMAPDAMQMIHEAWGLTVGNADDHHAAGDVLDTISMQIMSAYVAKSGKSEAEIRAAMKAETWFTADGAVGFGLADAVLDEDGDAVRPKDSAAKNRLALLQRQLDLSRASL